MRKFTSKCGEKEVELGLIMSWSEGERVQSGSVKQNDIVTGNYNNDIFNWVNNVMESHRKLLK